MTHQASTLINCMQRMVLEDRVVPFNGIQKTWVESLGDSCLSVTRSAFRSLSDTYQKTVYSPTGELRTLTLSHSNSKKKKGKQWKDTTGTVLLAAGTAPLAATGIGLHAVAMLLDTQYRKFCSTPARAYDPALKDICTFVHHTQSLRVLETGPDQFIVVGPLKLEECSCLFWNRALSDRRHRVISDIVQRLCSQCSKEETVRLGSLGPGGLATEFDVIAQLVLAGYSKFALDCIEPWPDTYKTPSSAERVLQFFRAQGVNIEINQYTDIHEVQTAWDALLAIDYDVLAVPYVSTRDQEDPRSRVLSEILNECKGAGDFMQARHQSKLWALTYMGNYVIGNNEDQNSIRVSQAAGVPVAVAHLVQLKEYTQQAFQAFPSTQELRIGIKQTRRDFMRDFRVGEILLATSLTLEEMFSKTPVAPPGKISIHLLLDESDAQPDPVKEAPVTQAIQKELRAIFPSIQNHEVMFTSMQETHSNPNQYSWVIE